MDLIGEVLGIAIFIGVALALILLSGIPGQASYLEERLARGEITEEHYRKILLARLGSL